MSANNNFNSYFSTLIITYLIESYTLRKVYFVNENELILNITSMVSVIGTPKEDIAIPSQNKRLYVEALNKNSGIIMIVLDDLVNANYIIRSNNEDLVYYKVNFEHDYIKKFVSSHGNALKYVSHPSYILKRPLCNNENSLCVAIENMKLEEEKTPNVNIKRENCAPLRKKMKYDEENENEDEYIDNNEIVKKLDTLFEKVENIFSNSNNIVYMTSETDPKIKYEVTCNSCSCNAFIYGKGKDCKHIIKLKKSENMNLKIENKKAKKEDINEDLNIVNIYSLQSESDLDKFYNIYYHINGNLTCSCPSYKYQYSKTNGACKHINSYLQNHYRKYDKFTLIDYFNKSNNKLLFLNNENDLSIYSKNISQKLFNNNIDTLYFNNDTKYHGLYVWVFDDSVENTDNTTTNNVDVDLHMGTYDGLK